MRTRYDMLITLKIEHRYFAGNYFDDFILTPNENTRHTIQQLGLLPKKVRNYWYLLYQSDGPRKTTAEALVDKEFSFILSISDSSFAGYTSPDFIPKPDAIQFFAATIDNRLFSSSRFIESPAFDYQLQHDERPVNIKLKKLKGEVLEDVAIVEPAVTEYAFDVTATGEQPYDISENTLPVTEEKKREIFVYRKYYDNRFYGMIYFKVLPVSGNNNSYTLVFEKK